MFEKGARVHFTEKKKWFCLVHHLNYYWMTTIKTGIVNNLDSAGLGLRTVPTIVIAHTFCASPDTRISYRQCLLIQVYFCAV